MSSCYPSSDNTLRTITHLSRIRYSLYNHTLEQGMLLYIQSHTWAGYATLRTITHLGRVHYAQSHTWAEYITYNHTLGQGMLLYLHLDRVCYFTYSPTLGQGMLLHLQSHTSWVGQGTYSVTNWWLSNAMAHLFHLMQWNSNNYG